MKLIGFALAIIVARSSRSLLHSTNNTLRR